MDHLICLAHFDEDTMKRFVGINWGAVIIDLAILGIALFVTLWRNNTSYLWLIALVFASGSYKIYEGE